MGKITTVFSGKGGVGKSTFTTLLAGRLCKKGYKVLLLEIDEISSSLDLKLGCEDYIVYNINDVLNGKCRPYDAVVQSKIYKNVYFISCLGGVKNFDLKKFKGFLDGISEFFNHIIIDFNLNMISDLLPYVDDAIAIVNTDPVTVKNTSYLTGKIDDECIKKMSFVINDLNLITFKNGYFDYIDEIIDDLNIRLLGIVKSDKTLKQGLYKDVKISQETFEIYDAICDRFLGKYRPLIIR
ncbi:MAG: P-loop NTPase [Oscillospiraceae bacterium]